MLRVVDVAGSIVRAVVYNMPCKWSTWSYSGVKLSSHSMLSHEGGC